MEIMVLIGSFFGTLVLLAILAALLHHDYLGWAVFITVLLVGGLVYAVEVNPFLWVWNNPLTTLTYAVLYLGIGIGWSIFKWDKYTKKRAETVEAKWTVSSEREKTTYRKYFDNNMPIALNCKWMITGWVAYWPASGLAYIFCDLMADLVEWIIKRFGRIYARITERHYREQA
jgi:hypothetical protein